MKQDHRILKNVVNARLGTVRWGSFDLIFSGRNSAGNEATFTITTPWILWPMIASYAAFAWTKEKEMREQEVKAIESTIVGRKVA